MASTRTENTRRNIVVSYLSTGVTLIFQFVIRSFIVTNLGRGYLGLSSLFTSILQVLNMAELGFSSAIVFSMYKPLADGDTDTVCALLALYRKIYRIVGVIILAVGIAVTPFVPYLIKDAKYPQEINIYFLYLLYLCNTAVSYFLFAYKSSLLTAMQRLDLTKFAYLIVELVQYGLQILVLVVFRNYYLFVIILILSTAFKNVFAAVIAKKKYPQYECRGKVSDEQRKDIMSRVKGLLICNISSVTYTTFDSIILSAFIGLDSVAVYNNYITVFNGLVLFINMLRTAMQASVGNSIASETLEKNYKDMLLWQFLFSGVATWCASCMFALYQPFMMVWMGPENLLPMRDVLLICVWFGVSVVQHSFFLYCAGNGLWWEMRWPYIGSTVCNLVLNIVLGKFFGTTGIIFASLFSTTAVGLFWQCSIVFKLYFKRSNIGFLKRQFGYFLVAAAIGIANYFACKYIPLDGWAGLIVRAVICLVVNTGLIVLVYYRTDMFKSALALGKRALKRKAGKLVSSKKGN